MNKPEELLLQQMVGEGLRIGAKWSTFLSGMVTTAQLKHDSKGAAVSYFWLRTIILSALQEFEHQAAHGFDTTHPDLFENMLEGLRDAIDDRLKNRRWPKA